MAQEPKSAADAIEGTTDPVAEANPAAQDAPATDGGAEEKKEAQSTMDAVKGKLWDIGAKANEVAQDLGAKANEVGSQVNARLTMEGQLAAARKHLATFLGVENKLEVEKQIPVQLMKDAQGIVFLSAIKASLGIGASIGSGVILAKLADGGWSGPCSIGLLGGQWGFNIGAQKTDFVIILRDEKAVKLFSSSGQIKFGADASIAAGPHGRDAQLAVGANKKGYASTFSYSMAKGLYVGVALEGQGIMVRDDCNAAYYGKEVAVGDVLGAAGDAVENDDYVAICGMVADYVKEAADDAADGAAEDAVGGGDQEEEAKQPL